ncbi:MAG: 6,7-dimethyl-8-ribityllumazine synthase [Chitinophagales bacterium]
MATFLKSLSDYDPANVPSGKGRRFSVIVSEYNSDITFALRDAAIETLLKHHVKEEDILLDHVPGTFELPSAAAMLYKKYKPDALICIGCVIKGETDHDKYINHAVAQGLVNLSLEILKPVIFGVLTPNTHQQALDRAGGKHGNKGVEAAFTALKMLGLQ